MRIVKTKKIAQNIKFDISQMQQSTGFSVKRRNSQSKDGRVVQ